MPEATKIKKATKDGSRSSGLPDIASLAGKDGEIWQQLAANEVF
jgi:hypothetical protein